MTAPATGNRRGAATRRRILDAAARCFERDGLQFTVDQVAEEAGTTRMTVHRHTGGREALVRHVVVRAFADVVGRATGVLDGPGPFADRLTGAMAEAVAGIRAAPHLLVVFAPTSGPVWWKVDPDDRVLDTVRDVLRPYFEAAAAAGELREDPGASLEWVLHQFLLYLAVPDAIDHDRMVDDLRRFVGPALTARPSTGPG